MSADAWYYCPHCRGKKHPEYGTQEQIRADYELWLGDDGLWKIRGAARCAVCSRAWIANITIEPCTETSDSEAWRMCNDKSRITNLNCFGKQKAEALRTPPNPKGSGIRAGDRL